MAAIREVNDMGNPVTNRQVGGWGGCVDQALLDLVGGRSDRFEVKFKDAPSGEIELRYSGRFQSYRLKPLEELYGTGMCLGSVDPLIAEYMPLVYAIESTILHYYDEHPELNDTLVAVTLDRLAINPACNPAGDMLCHHLQTGLRVELSVHNYSKQEVKQALRVVLKSVNRHTRSGGITGYLEFMDRMMIA